MASIFETAGIEVKPTEPIKSPQQNTSPLFNSGMQLNVTPEKKDVVSQLSGILSKLTFNGSTDLHVNLANSATKEIQYRAEKPYNPNLSFISDPQLRNTLEGNKPGFMEPGDYRLPQGYAPPFKDPSSEISTSVGGGDGEPAYLIPTFKYGKRLQDPMAEFKATGQHIGGPFKTVADAEAFATERHKYIDKGEKTLPTPLARSNYEDAFEKFKATLPPNLANTPNKDYDMKYLWEHSGKPKDLAEFQGWAPGTTWKDRLPIDTKAMKEGKYVSNDRFDLVKDVDEKTGKISYNYHGFSVEPTTGRFLKPKHHSTLHMELDWYKNSKDPSAVEFRKNYELKDLGDFYQYVPRNNKSSNPEASNLSANEKPNPSETNNVALTNYVGKAFERYANRTYDDKINKYIFDYADNNDVKLTQKDMDVLKKEWVNYINSPEYAKRQAMNPDVYNGNISEETQKFFADFVAKAKRDKRIEITNNLGLNIHSKDKPRIGHFDPIKGVSGIVELSEGYPVSALEHEVGHSNSYPSARLTEEEKLIMQKNNGVLEKRLSVFSKQFPSDKDNSIVFYKGVKAGEAIAKEGKEVKDSPDAYQYIYNSLNNNEVAKFVKLAREVYTSDQDVDDGDPFAKESKWDKEEHYSKNAPNKSAFAGEQYGDLMGVRGVLYRNGITKSFGEDLDEEKMKNAINNPEITKDPVFRRFYRRYGMKNIIELNNTIAMNNKGKDSGNRMA